MPYMDIVKHYENCYEKYGDNHKGVDWPKEEDVETRYRVMTDIMEFNKISQGEGDVQKQNSFLDFGCGLGHLYEYIVRNGIAVDYTGLDISEKFVAKCKEKFPEVDFIVMDLLQEKNVKLPYYDYIALNGVFTEKRNLKYEEMLEYFKSLFIKAFKICRRGIAFNVMSKDVDWERDDLFHLPLDTLSNFLSREITRNFIIRYDYGLYEYTVYVFK